MEKLNLQPEQLFYRPRDASGEHLLAAGRYSFWRNYEDASQPSLTEFKGYNIFADPFHHGQGRISFLLGADCSHFAHRVLQLLGVGAPYLKTRHWIQLARRRLGNNRKMDRPSDLSECAWNRAVTGFRLVDVTTEAVDRGDIVVFASETGPLGDRGHMGIVTGIRPTKLLHARGPREGIQETALQTLSKAQDAFVFRWVGALGAAHESLESALGARHKSDPSGCSD